ncbi:CBS and ACT domain-containing protein [Desulfovibrio inopinatus]|uniref:CBS and ACT domain-containing protein n=1 Tax=Desulfovibrio inopinatus TaxID=102109 RepID=UPI0004196EFC|nr:CBS and ACT domain-containing protein [Desulfovibrio inopinatus]
MLVKHWMSTDVTSVTPETSMMRASKTMKENGLRRLPVVNDKNRVVGIVTDSDIKEASPSKATTLDVHELYYLLSEIKVGDIMTKNPLTVAPDDTVEEAAVIMFDKKIGGLPVIDKDNFLVGILTESDVNEVVISITGVKYGGIQLAIDLSDEPGNLPEVLRSIIAKGGRILSILTGYDETRGNGRRVYIRIRDMDPAPLAELKADIDSKFNVFYWKE